LENGDVPVPLIKLLASHLSGDASTPYSDLVQRMPISTEHIHDLLEVTSEIDPDFLRLIGRLDFRMAVIQRPLRVAYINRILSIARRSDDELVVAGSIISVVGSRFYKLAGVDLLLKMLANREAGAALAQLTFRGQVIGDETRDLTVVQEVARSIMRRPERFELYTVQAATSFWAEHTRGEFPPLSSANKDLHL
jgi:hypothetical protein